jgi:hypothetical protein
MGIQSQAHRTKPSQAIRNRPKHQLKSNQMQKTLNGTEPMVPYILCLGVFIIGDTESFATRPFGVRQTTTCSPVVCRSTITEPQKQEKVTPEARELKQVLQEKESGTCTRKMGLFQSRQKMARDVQQARLLFQRRARPLHGKPAERG